MRRYAFIGSLVGAFVALAGAWINGFAFQRGPDALGVYILTLWFSAVGAASGAIAYDVGRLNR